MTQKEIVKLKSRFDDFAKEFSRHADFLDDNTAFRDIDLVCAAVNAGKCSFIADIIGDQHLIEQSRRIADKLTSYYFLKEDA